jgi:two-component system, sensor histidine kinase and response regulator
MPKILVIEDANDLRDDIVELLSLEGFEVIDASNGQIGVEKAQKERPDLIICDVMMPYMDGYQVLEVIRKNPDTTATPFVFLTSKTERNNIRQGMVMGADDYLTKPFLVKELMDTVTSQLKKHQGFTNVVNQRLEELRENITTALPHELRTPLNTIIGFSDMLKNEAGNAPATQIIEWADHISSAAHRLYRMAENYLAYARISIAENSPEQLLQYQSERLTGIDAIIDSQAQKVADHFNRLNDLQTELMPTDNVNVGFSDIIKITEELLDNAFKFSPAGTTVSVIGREVNQYYQIQVIDRGRGINPEQASRIGAYMQFDRWFYEQQGMGLGLAIVSRLVSLYNGKFDLQLLDEGGTSATVSLLIN